MDALAAVREGLHGVVRERRAKCAAPPELEVLVASALTVLPEDRIAGGLLVLHGIESSGRYVAFVEPATGRVVGNEISRP